MCEFVEKKRFCKFLAVSSVMWEAVEETFFKSSKTIQKNGKRNKLGRTGTKLLKLSLIARFSQNALGDFGYTVAS